MKSDDDSKSSWVAKLGAGLSVVALLFTLFSFVWSSAWPATMKIRAGDAIFISYGYDGNIGVVAPLVYANQGSLSGIVSQVHLVCGKQGTNNTVSLYPIYYVKIDKGNNEMESFVAPEQIKGGEQITRLILFWSGVDRIKTNDFDVGDYACGVMASDGRASTREFTRFSFPVRQEDIDHLKAHPPAGANRFIFTHESGVQEAVIRSTF